ncbi:MAG: ATP-binding domain-containing protein [Spirochaetaceae bacterium]|jgi:DNA helicase-2/ATP-dependent DNA helicase PcrA|nr:ATP-binding domain-containing protein [Spirochaetaceae bacterium]
MTQYTDNNTVNTDTTIQFPDEIAHLEEINAKIDDTLRESDAGIKQIDTDYMDFKRYTMEHTSDPHEGFQNQLLLNQVDRSGAFFVKMRNLTAQLVQSPYFARIDFQEKESPAVTRYIGAASFMYGNELLVIDWRAPFASMFYDYELGSAGYDAPQKRVEGELSRKRQFKIKNRKLLYVLESSLNIQDDVLQRELSQTSDSKMKSIIATIQKEQNRIIRNEGAEILIIQGVAGSGKTSIALHRIAFLLYRFKKTLTSRDITIISPNKVFGDYISNVLPELGEERINQSTFADIAGQQLNGIIAFETDKNPQEAHDPHWGARVRFKSTLIFLKLLDYYIERMTESVFEPKEYIHRSFTVSAEWIRRRYNTYTDLPVKQRLRRIAEDIHERFEAFKESGDPTPGVIPSAPVILKSLNKMLTVQDSLFLYTDFFRQMDRAHMYIPPAKKTLEWSDVFPFLYIHGAFEGFRTGDTIKHLVIDEMQDYTPIKYAVIKQLFRCPMTILGDFGQLVNPNHLNTIADILEIYPKAELFELTKSYRSTYEIITFAKKIGNIHKLEPMERHGTPPAILPCGDAEGQLSKLTSEIDVFLQSGYTSLAIILKTNNDAQALFNQLSNDYDVHLISSLSTRFANGISITSIQASKGLEFDEVILPNVNKNIYESEYDRNLLYIACTRAMHKLTLLYTEEVSPLLGFALKDSKNVPFRGAGYVLSSTGGA